MNLPPYSIYTQSFNFRPAALPEILLDEKSITYNHPLTNQLVQADTAERQLYTEAMQLLRTAAAGITIINYN